jgi:hypothetical protein
LSSGELTYTSAGTCGVTATKAADDTFAEASSSETTFTIDQVTPIISITNSPAAFDGNPQAVSISGSVAGTVATILYDGSSIIPTNAGTYAVIANFTPTDTTNYSTLIGGSAGNFVIASLDTQETLVTTAQTVNFQDSFAALSITGGSGTGAVTFAVSDAGTADCSASGSTLSFTSAGTCGVTATKASDATYNVASSVPQTFTVSLGTQEILSFTGQTVNFQDTFAALSITG